MELFVFVSDCSLNDRSDDVSSMVVYGSISMVISFIILQENLTGIVLSSGVGRT